MFKKTKSLTNGQTTLEKQQQRKGNLANQISHSLTNGRVFEQRKRRHQQRETIRAEEEKKPSGRGREEAFEQRREAFDDDEQRREEEEKRWTTREREETVVQAREEERSVFLLGNFKSALSTMCGTLNWGNIILIVLIKVYMNSTIKILISSSRSC
ncbi:uncharacterized protein G2W53_014207 [Senna tora]|uniref:Uncharacterized protein n=1 Tax=Senna tora TaxID=362788 RepID=A0A834WT77_9FABA|nr:uncharacterized protein G2W53_014207 [Senna tora]